MSSALPVFSEAATAFCTLALVLAILAPAGLMLINAGLTRTRSVSHSLFTGLCAMALAAVVYAFCGFSFQGTGPGPAHAFYAAGRSWSWLGDGRIFLRGMPGQESSAVLIALFGITGAALVALLPAAAAAERWRLAASLATTAVLAGWTYPLFAHWVWGGGWLQGLSGGLGLRDAAGSGSIHAVGGLTALSVCWLTGARRGKFLASGMPTATPGHNGAFVLFGCVLALCGWLGLNIAGSLLFAAAGVNRAPLIAINTFLCAAGGLLSAAFITRARFGKPDASLGANGWVCGLVSSSAGCAALNPAEMLLTGLIAGTVAIFAIEIVELRMKVDDPTGAISVHAAGGIWGLLAVGFFSSVDPLLPQLIGISTLVGFVFPMSYGLNWLLNRILPFRAAPEGDRQGMDLFELGAGAYPEFMIHRDDLNFR